MGYFIKELTYEQLRPLITEKSVVVLPIGGGAKEHGNHLPMGTDYFVTDWVANAVTARENVLTLPTLPYAYFPAFVHWEGSVSVSHQHFTSYVRDILECYVRFGVKKFLIIDGGVSTHPPLCLMARDMNNELGVKVAVTDITQLAKDAEADICSQPRGGHGDEAETSTLLYIREDLVHMDKTVEEYTQPWPGSVVNGRTVVNVPCRMRTPTGTNGDSTLATKEKGEKILNAMVDEICGFVHGFVAWQPEEER